MSLQVILISTDTNAVTSLLGSSNPDIKFLEFVPPLTTIGNVLAYLKGNGKFFNADAVLLDFNLWENITAKDLIPTIKELELPFFAFSGDYHHQQYLMAHGAQRGILKKDEPFTSEIIDKIAETIHKFVF